MEDLSTAELLYHGSTVEVQRVDLSKGVPKKDFGAGFYTTSVQLQAEKFAVIKAAREKIQRGFVSVYEFCKSKELKIFNFKKADIEWLNYVLLNRGYLQEQAMHEAGQADVITGPVANDAVGLVLNQLMAGTYGDPTSRVAKETAIRLLETEKLYNQVFFRTQKAVDCLKFIKSYGVNR